MFYPVVLTLHNIVRWLVVIAAILAIVRAINGLAFKRGYTQQDNKVGFWFTITMDIQVLLGILLYFFLSPITMSAMQNFGGAMGNAAVRFYAVEHILIMILALGVAHMGRSFIRKGSTAPEKHRRTLIWFGLAILLVLIGIPWSRPLLPAVFGL
ncbi:MAG: hypothetical protein IH586_12745 [Anaerolineaceae bacterium]|nr:hypothetical protein [Anaerolineaceae bacterium]